MSSLKPQGRICAGSDITIKKNVATSKKSLVSYFSC